MPNKRQRDINRKRRDRKRLQNVGWVASAPLGDLREWAMAMRLLRTENGRYAWDAPGLEVIG